MALPDFEYFRPRTLAEALRLLAAHGDGAKVLAGGQSLVPLLSMRLVRPGALVDIGRLDELRYIRDAGGHLEIGALTTHRAVAGSELVQQRCPVLAQAAALIGHSHIRTRGTIGGSLAHADPAAEHPVACVLSDARLVLAGPQGQRRLDAADFFLAPLVTALATDEVLTAVEMPATPAGTGTAFLELVLRSGDFALVSAAAWVTPGPDGTVAAVGIAVGGAHPVPLRARSAETAAPGRTAGPELWARLGELAAGDLEPEGDIHASAGYRRDMAAIYVRDALAAAYAKAGDTGGS